MTVIGAHVLAPDLAVCWADSEFYCPDTDQPRGTRNKLAVNPAGFAFTMAGWSTVAERAATAAVSAPDLATALQRLPWVLRRASEQVAQTVRHPGDFATQHAALIGWDAATGGMVAYRMTASECFAPMLDDRQTVPEPLFRGTDPIGPDQVRALAARQLLRLRECVPTATGGPLHVAVIRPDGVSLSRLCDLADEAPAPIETEPVKEPA